MYTIYILNRCYSYNVFLHVYSNIIINIIIINIIIGERNALAFIKRRVLKRGHAVIVVAEGFGERIFGKSNEKDAGGNRKLTAVGVSN